MTLLGVDLNATRARASAGPAGAYPGAVVLDPPHAGLALAVSVAGGRADTGARALRRCRRAPHLARVGFLPALGAREAAARPLEADRAIALVFDRVAGAGAGTAGSVLGVPAYLSARQVGLLSGLARDAGLPLAGAVRAPLALALAGHAEAPWAGAALVLDVDDHALTLAAVTADGGRLRLDGVEVLPRLGLRAWRGRLLDALADRCILQNRRDPRDSPAAEQAVFDRLDAVFDACRQDRPVRVAVEAPGWDQTINLRPEDVRAACAPLTQLALARAAGAFAGGAVFVSAEAGRLPGVAEGLRASCDAWRAAWIDADGRRAAPAEDFGEELLEEDDDAAVVVLAADAAARAAHGLAAHLARGDLDPGCLDDAAPLPLPLPAEAGPPRLRYRGEEYPVDRSPFTVGRQPFCDLAFDGDAYPTVAPRHCEVVWAEGAFTVWDHSRAGTLVNDCPVGQMAVLDPGDSIRLGPDGPRLRFLGHAAPRPGCVRV